MCKSHRTTTNKETVVKQVWKCAHIHTHIHPAALHMDSVQREQDKLAISQFLPGRRLTASLFCYSLRVQALTNLHHQKKANHIHNKISPHTCLPLRLRW